MLRRITQTAMIDFSKQKRDVELTHSFGPRIVACFLAALITAAGMSLNSSLTYAQPKPGEAVASPPDNPDAEDEDVSIRIPSPPECLARAGNWTEPEKWAWQQICARERIDFDKRAKITSPPERLRTDTLKSDASRRLGASFMRELFENPQLSVFTQNASIDITGAYIPTIQLSDGTIGSLRIADSWVDGGISLESATILRSLRISKSMVGDVNLSRTKGGGDVNIASSKLSSFQGMLLNIGRLSVVSSQIDRFELRISRLSQQLAVLAGSFERILLDDIKSDGLFIRPTSAALVSINDYVDAGMFYLAVRRWEGDSSLKISTMTTGRFFLRGDSVPDEVDISGLSLSGGADWGPNPLPYLKANAQYNPALFGSMAASYAEAGQPDVANAILIEKQNAEYRHAASYVDKAYLFVIWLLADYGYRPELGLLWIIGFVIVAALIFKTGEHQIKQGNPPGSWLVFAFDSARPGLQLNKEHADVQVLGWRQGFLYLLRFLSAVVVVLVIEMMKKSVSGL